jgi:hypothetical protein
MTSPDVTLRVRTLGCRDHSEKQMNYRQSLLPIRYGADGEDQRTWASLYAAANIIVKRPSFRNS